MTVLIRPMKVGDSPKRLAGLITDLTKNTPKKEILKDNISRLPFFPPRALWQVGQDLSSGKLVALSGIIFLEDHRAVIEEVVVDPKYRRQGICFRMMELLIDEARKREVHEIRLITSNPVAEYIYGEKLGFQVQMSDNEPAKVMVYRWLNASEKRLLVPLGDSSFWVEGRMHCYFIPSKGWVVADLWPTNLSMKKKFDLAQEFGVRQFKMLVQNPDHEMICSEFGFARSKPKPGQVHERVMARSLV